MQMQMQMQTQAQAQWMPYASGCNMVLSTTGTGQATSSNDFGMGSMGSMASRSSAQASPGCSGGFQMATQMSTFAPTACNTATGAQWPAGNQVSLAAAVAADACQRLQQQQQQQQQQQAQNALAQAIQQATGLSASAPSFTAPSFTTTSGGWPSAAMLTASQQVPEAKGAMCGGAFTGCTSLACGGDAGATGFGNAVGFPTSMLSPPPPPQNRPSAPTGLSFGDLEAKLARSYESWANTEEAKKTEESSQDELERSPMQSPDSTPKQSPRLQPCQLSVALAETANTQQAAPSPVASAELPRRLSTEGLFCPFCCGRATCPFHDEKSPQTASELQRLFPCLAAWGAESSGCNTPSSRSARNAVPLSKLLKLDDQPDNGEDASTEAGSSDLWYNGASEELSDPGDGSSRSCGSSLAACANDGRFNPSRRPSSSPVARGEGPQRSGKAGAKTGAGQSRRPQRQAAATASRRH